MFFVADVQTGFGPFVAVYLTTQKWTQIDIGLVLSIGGIVALIGQMPGGAIVDAARSERLVAGIALAAIAAQRARLCAVADLSRGAAAAARCMPRRAACSGPCIAAISLGLVGYAAIGERLGRNARFASIGNGIAAAAMGASDIFFRRAAVFFVTAALLIPTAVRAQPHPPARRSIRTARMAAGRRKSRSTRRPRCAASCGSGRC